jgi:hypothetical protein
MRAGTGMVSKLLSLIAGGALLSGCAANSGVVSTGQNTFIVSRQAATGFSGSGNLKAEALNEASQYCTNQQKSVSIVNVREAQPPFVMGNFPKAEVQFTCWDATKIDAIIAECNDRRIKKEIKGFKAAVECSSPRVIAAWRERQYPYMDLINVYEASRLVGAENVDRGKISEAEYKLQLAELQSRITAEDQRRGLAIANAQIAQAQVDASNAQANAAMLHGLSAFITATRGPPTYNVNVCRTAPGQVDTCSYPR